MKIHVSLKLLIVQRNGLKSGVVVQHMNYLWSCSVQYHSGLISIHFSKVTSNQSTVTENLYNILAINCMGNLWKIIFDFFWKIKIACASIHPKLFLKHKMTNSSLQTSDTYTEGPNFLLDCSIRRVPSNCSSFYPIGHNARCQSFFFKLLSTFKLKYPTNYVCGYC